MANPEDKQMKMQWITVDGKTVPLVLPQIWDPVKEDWVVTSTENPLQVDAQLTGSKSEQLTDVLEPRSDGWINYSVPHFEENVFEQMVTIKNTTDVTIWVALRAVMSPGGQDMGINLIEDYKILPNDYVVFIPESIGHNQILSVPDLRMPYQRFTLVMRPRTSETNSDALAPTTGQILIERARRF